MNYAVDLDEQQYAMLCGDVSLLSAGGRKDVWSALPVCGRWRLLPGELEAAEMRTLFLIRGMADAARGNIPESGRSAIFGVWILRNVITRGRERGTEYRCGRRVIATGRHLF